MFEKKKLDDKVEKANGEGYKAKTMTEKIDSNCKNGRKKILSLFPCQSNLIHAIRSTVILKSHTDFK